MSGVAVSSGVGQLRCLEVEHAGGRSTRLMQNCSMRDCSEYTKKIQIAQVYKMQHNLMDTPAM